MKHIFKFNLFTLIICLTLFSLNSYSMSCEGLLLRSKASHVLLPKTDFRVKIDHKNLKDDLSWNVEKGQLLLRSTRFVSEISEIKSYPEHLYHWTDESSKVVSLLEKANSETKFKVPFAANISRFSALKAAPRGGLFAFHNLYAYQGGLSEKYGSELVRMTIKPGARVLRFHIPDQTKMFDYSYVSTKEFEAVANLKDYDLVYLDGGAKEWLVLNPEIVETATDSPKALKSSINDALQNLYDENFSLPLDHWHFNFFQPVIDHGINLFEDIIGQQIIEVPGKSVEKVKAATPSFDFNNVDSILNLIDSLEVVESVDLDTLNAVFSSGNITPPESSLNQAVFFGDEHILMTFRGFTTIIVSLKDFEMQAVIQGGGSSQISLKLHKRLIQ